MATAGTRTATSKPLPPQHLIGPITIVAAVCALLCGAAFAGGYLLASRRIDSLAAQNADQADQLGRLNREVSEAKSAASSATKAVDGIRSQISQRQQAARQAERGEYQRRLKFAEGLEKERQAGFDRAIASMPAPMRERISDLIRRMKAGEKIYWREFQVVTDSLAEFGALLPYDAAWVNVNRDGMPPNAVDDPALMLGVAETAMAELLRRHPGKEERLDAIYNSEVRVPIK